MQLSGWLDTTQYSFDSKEYETAVSTTRYVGRRNGSPIVIVHWDPCSSFLPRAHPAANPTQPLRGVESHRLRALEQTGNWDYLPAHHAEKR